MDERFQVHLRGIIQLLSEHLYSGPHVFVRELLQNATDAIRARTGYEHDFCGSVGFELIDGPAGTPPTLVITDDGVGLTLEEARRFLSTIGDSSKRDVDAANSAELLAAKRGDFLGQFGIGLLSCFLVSDEIAVITRSAKPHARDEAPVEWRGRPDGTYQVRTLENDLAFGTQVYLRCRPGCEEFFDAERLEGLLRHFGSLLPPAVRLTADGRTIRINDDPPPWRLRFPSHKKRQAALKDYGQRLFETPFLDAIPLRSEAGRVEGVAFVLARSPSPSARQQHRVYLKNMLLAENVDGLLPDWAFFVRCVVNADDLRPTAAREGFYEDEAFSQARQELGACLRNYLVELSESDPERLERLIAVHHLAIKGLAVHDDEFCRLFADWLPFETSQGEMTLGEIRARNEMIRFVPSRDRFRGIAGIASAQSLCIVNGGYVHEAELLSRLPEILEGVEVEVVDPADLTHELEEPTEIPADVRERFLELAQQTLRPFRCAAELKAYDPHELPALYATARDGDFRRAVERSKEVADDLFSGMLDAVTPLDGGEPLAQLCFNARNPLVERLVRRFGASSSSADAATLGRAIEILYVQSLLLGHHPLSGRELTLLTGGLGYLLDLVADDRGT